MRTDFFFDLAREAGIEEAELSIQEGDSLEISLFHGEVDNYTTNHTCAVQARGLVNGKFGTAACDGWSKEKARYLAKEIARNAAVIENDDPAFIFGGSPRYKKIDTFNKELSDVTAEEKLQKLHQLEDYIRSYDPRISEVEAVCYAETSGKTTLVNTKGLKLSRRQNYYVFYAGAVAKQGEQVKTGNDVFLHNDFSAFDVEALGKKVAEEALSKLGGIGIEAAKYPVVLGPDTVQALMSCYMNSVSAEEVQKHSSMLAGKLGEQVAAYCITIEDRPLDKTLFAVPFDDEGVATSNKAIISQGKLKTYLYNLTTAAKDGVESTGNAVRGADKMGVSPFCLSLRPGKKTREELFAQVGNGVFVTAVTGLHCGMNTQSGNFSLLADGFLIEDGKKGRPLDILTVSGNLMDVFMKIKAVGNDVKTFPGGESCPSVMLPAMNISGK